ncbi:MAG TPA: hypothetical protein VIJ75_19485 [Hanamia sp.]
MKSILICLVFLTLTSICKAQNEDRIYSFMNNELPPLEPGKSSWGIFTLNQPVVLDSENYKQIVETRLKNVPQNIQQELYQKCTDQDVGWANRFHWQQKKMMHVIVVSDTKFRVSTSVISGSGWAKNDVQNANYWIKEWNQAKPDDRLVNYSSLSVFSNNQQYVLILRGQASENDGGWDTIYIYKKEGDKWTIADKIIVTEL